MSRVVVNIMEVFFKINNILINVSNNVFDLLMTVVKCQITKMINN